MCVFLFVFVFVFVFVCVCVCVCFVCVCVCVCVCDSGRRTSATWSWRLASRRGPQPLFGAPLLKVYAGLIVAPESGAYTVACIDLLTFQEELP